MSCRDDLQVFGGHKGALATCLLAFSLNVCLVLARLLLLLRRHFAAHFRAREAWAWAAECARELRQRLRAALAAGAEVQDPEAAQVQREAERQRLLGASRNLDISSLLLIPSLMFVTFRTSNLLLSAESSEEAYAEAVRYLCDTEGVPLMFTAGIALILAMVPSLVTPSNLDCANVFLSGMWAWRFAVGSDTHYDYNGIWILACRTMQGLVCGNARLTILLHSAVSGAGVAVSLYRHSLTFSRNYPYRDLLMLLMISALTWTFERTRLAEAKATVHARHTDRGSRLVQRALSCMCDAVVRVDAKLRLTRPCPQLSSLLLRECPVPPGVRFTDFMPPEDAERLRVCLSSCVSSGSKEESLEEDSPDAQGIVSELAGLCHVHLRDGVNSKVPVELYYSCMLDVGGEPSYLIGIQEDHESQPRYPDAAQGLEPPSIEEAQLTALPEDFRADASIRASSWTASEFIGEEAESPHVWVDAAAKNLPVLDCSSGFALLGGPGSSCGALSECLSTSDLAKVCAWLAEQPLRGSCPAQLRPLGAEWTYDCSLSAGLAHDAPTAAASASPVCLAIDDLRMNWHKRKPGVVACEILGETRSRQGRLQSLQSNGCDEVLNLLVSICSGRISKIAGGRKEHRQLFKRHKSLLTLLDRREAFWAFLRDGMNKFVGTGVNNPVQLRINLGSFVFRQPGADEPRCRLIGDVALVDISEEDPDFLHLRITHLRDLEPSVRKSAGPGWTGRPSEAQVQRSMWQTMAL